MGLFLSWALLTVMLLGNAAVPSAARRTRPARTNITGVAVVMEQDSLRSRIRQPKRVLKLRLESGKILNTKADPKYLTKLYTGQRIRLHVSTAKAATLKSLIAENKALVIETDDMIDPIDPLEEVPPDVVVIPDGVGQEALPFSAFVPLKTKLKLLVVPLKAETNGVPCGGTNPPIVIPYTLSQMNTFILTKSPAGTAPSLYTLPSAYEDWSHGVTQIDTVNSKVADWVILPCVGNSSTGTYRNWTLDQCCYNCWTPYVDSVLAKRGINLASYDLIQYVLPQTFLVCGWCGMGQVGCVVAGKCKQWLSAKQWNKHALWGHEQAHAFSLSHSQQGTDVAGDKSGLMGTCCSFRRHNTVHAWQLGWQNLYQLSEVELPAGDTLVLKLLPQSVKGSKGVRIKPTWATGVQPFFVGYRDGLGTDVELLTTYKYKVNIYQSPVSFQQDSQKSYYVAGLDATTTMYKDATTGLTFRRLNGSTTEVFITICRYGGAENQGSCCDGRDRDCNGQGGATDATCTDFMPNCVVPRVFSIRQHLYVTNPACSNFVGNYQTAYKKAAASISGYSDVTVGCDYAGAINGGRLRIWVQIDTPPVAYAPARATAEAVNMAVYNTGFATAVRTELTALGITPSTAGGFAYPTTGDGFCVREKETNIDWTPCPPVTPKQTKSTLKHSVRLDTLPRQRF